jgi:hypothetical protein
MSWANIHTGYFYLQPSFSVHATLKSAPCDFIVQEITLLNEILKGQNVSFCPATIPIIRPTISPQGNHKDQKQGGENESGEDLRNEKEEMELKIEQAELGKLQQYQQDAENGK